MSTCLIPSGLDRAEGRSVLIKYAGCNACQVSKNNNYTSFQAGANGPMCKNTTGEAYQAMRERLQGIVVISKKQ